MSSNGLRKHTRAAVYPLSAILRGRGFVPLPRLWVKSEDMPGIIEIANKYAEEVNSVRRQLDTKETPDPRTNKDAAWAAMEKANGGPTW